MPRLGSDISISSSIRRRNHSQTRSQRNSQTWSTRSVDSPPTNPPSRDDSSSSRSLDYDVADDFLSHTRASGSRTRWHARTSASPYRHGQRVLSKWSPSEQKHLEEMGLLMDLLPEPSDHDHEMGQKKTREVEVESSAATGKRPETAGPVEEAGQDTFRDDATSEQGEANFPPDAPPPPSAAAVRMSQNNESKSANARMNADTISEPPPVLEATPHPQRDFLASMTRITDLVESMNVDASDDRSRDSPSIARHPLNVDGQTALTDPAQWRMEVLHRVRRMENMLDQMDKWHTHVGLEEIEVLKEETARLEGRVREMAEQKIRGKLDISTTGKGKEGVQVEAGEVEMLSSQEAHTGLDERRSSQAGARDPEEGDTESVSDNSPESSSSLSESETGPTEPDPEDRSPLDDKVSNSESLPLPPPSLPVPTRSEAPPSLQLPTQYAQVPPGPPGQPSTTPSADTVSPTSLSTLAPKNYNLPPEPPRDPIQYIHKNPWTMLEVLFLLEIVAHFPPAEHGWTFITEAYNNILITRPLQEWFGKQASTSHEEEAKMKTILHNMSTEARQSRSRADQAPVSATGQAKATAKKGDRRKAAPFGSAEARAEANAHAKSSAASPVAAAPDKIANDALVVTRLPFPLEVLPAPADSKPTPPPAQCIVPFPRRRPPLTLPSADARAFTRVMKSAAGGVRPPSTESRAAMLALYSATKSRFPVRTPWDCWHRWCTPWIVQQEQTDHEDTPSVVLDYVAGNLAVPCGTWFSQSPGFQYRPVPGTYPDALGVQHRVSAGYDPRMGMVSLARMTHLIAEKTWSANGLGRESDGRVTEEVLGSRRAKLPATLAGLWPGKAQPPVKAGAKARPSAPPSAPSTSTSPSVASATSGKQPITPVQDNARIPPRTEPTAATSTSRPKPAVTKPARQPNATPPPPSLPFRPLPTPRKPPPRDAPCVPEGTFGNTKRPGIRAWFDHAAVRRDVVEWLVAVENERETFVKGLGPAKAEGSAYSDTSMNARVKEWEEERERERVQWGKWVPLHLRKVVVPPSPRRLPRLMTGETAEAVS